MTAWPGLDIQGQTTSDFFPHHSYNNYNDSNTTTPCLEVADEEAVAVVEEADSSFHGRKTQASKSTADLPKPFLSVLSSPLRNLASAPLSAPFLPVHDDLLTIYSLMMFLFQHPSPIARHHKSAPSSSSANRSTTGPFIPRPGLGPRRPPRARQRPALTARSRLTSAMVSRTRQPSTPSPQSKCQARACAGQRGHCLTLAKGRSVSGLQSQTQVAAYFRYKEGRKKEKRKKTPSTSSPFSRQAGVR